MIIEQALGAIQEENFKNLSIDYLDMEWFNTHKKIERKVTRAGREVGIRMNHEMSHRGWHSDDVLYVDNETAIVINILPAKCLKITVTDPEKLVKLCYEIGNRHAPFFYGSTKSEFLTPYERPMETLITKLGLSVQTVKEVLAPDKRISSAHGHGHSHNH